MQPGGERVIGSELPGASSQRGEHVLGDLLGAGRIAQFANRRPINEVQVTANQSSEGGLVTLMHESTKEFEVVPGCIHIPTLSCRRRLKSENKISSSHFGTLGFRLKIAFDLLQPHVCAVGRILIPPPRPQKADGMPHSCGSNMGEAP